MRKIDKEKVVKQLLHVNKKFDEVEKNISLSKDGLVSNDNNLFEESLKTALFDAEKQYIQLKRLAAETIDNKVTLKEIYNKELSTARIKIEQLDNGVIKLSVPIILPFKKLKDMKLYPNNFDKPKILEVVDRTDSQGFIIQKAVYEFVEKNNISFPPDTKATILYLNVFKKGFANNRIPDSDNYQYKVITDILTTHLLSGIDNWDTVDFMYKTHYGSDTHTEIYFIPEHIDDSLEIIKNLLKSLE